VKLRKRRSVLEEERRSFGFAYQGIRHAWATQRHLRIHAAVAVLAVVLGVFLRLSGAEWAVLCLTITLVLVLEMLNTVVEAAVDLASPDYHPLAKIAKDVAAGAVLLSACGGIGVGALLFLPKLWALVSP
jgi:diacylglycerol kinase